MAAAAIGFWLATSLGSAQPRLASPGELPAINASVQTAIIDSIGAAMSKAYVFADIAARMDSLLRVKLTAGEYRELTDPAEFMRKVSEDMSGVYNDKHLQAGAFAPFDLTAQGQRADDPKLSEEFKENMRKANFGFRKVEILPGNIGYLEFKQFAPTSIAGETAVGVMNFLANADAMIIDLRQNGGGSASMIQLLTGYFFEEPQHLVSWYSRETDQTEQSYSQAFVPGQRMYETPLYILTSNFTGSAAEEFTYDLKNLKRATIVGETTGGGAHTVSDVFFDFRTFVVGQRVPSGRAISPITKTNWEGVGVEPDISVPADKALPAAKLEAIKKLSEKAENEGEKATLAWAQVSLENEIHPYHVATKDLKQYIGNFGPRRIFLENGALIYQREGRPKYRMVPMAKDLFAVEDLDYFRLRFARDDKGKIDAVVGLYDDGREDRNLKGK
ncbi:MAG TPA: S41 family peptidase [bacterium]|jgi:hypothetical protein